MCEHLGRKEGRKKRAISSIQASKSKKGDFRHIFGAKVCYSNGNVRFQNFMQVEWSEEKS